MKITVDKEVLEQALKRAFNLGQTYWQQADSEYPSHWKKADVTLASFNQLVDDTCREVLEQQCVCGEPNSAGTHRTDGPCFAPQPESAVPERQPLTDREIIHLVPGLLDCLCDPWDYNNSGDYYASIPKDMIRLARAVEAHHGITGENK